MVHKLVEHNKRLMLWILYEAISEREDANMQFNFDKIIVPVVASATEILVQKTIEQVVFAKCLCCNRLV